MGDGHGSVEEEYAALRDSAALLDDSDRVVLLIRGADAREHFGGLVTNHVEALAPGRALYAFMLTPRGRPVAEMRVLAREPEEGDEVLWADLPAACAGAAVDHLGRYLPPRLASWEALDSVVRLAVVGPDAEEALRSADVDGPPPEPLTASETELPEPGVPATVVRREAIEGPGFDLYLPAASLREARDALGRAVRGVGGRPAGSGAREIWRVERGIPIYGAEIDTDVLPQETGQGDRAIDHEKGCYTGQEVVARIHHRGKVNRRLRGLRPAGDPASPVGPGDELFADGRSRATVTSAVRSPRLGPLALGYVRRELDPGDALALEPDGDPVWRVEELPFVPPPSG
jgi:folate-binding protein YgfZ